MSCSFKYAPALEFAGNTSFTERNAMSETYASTWYFALPGDTFSPSAKRDEPPMSAGAHEASASSKMGPPPKEVSLKTFWRKVCICGARASSEVLGDGVAEAESSKGGRSAMSRSGSHTRTSPAKQLSRERTTNSSIFVMPCSRPSTPENHPDLVLTARALGARDFHYLLQRPLPPFCMPRGLSCMRQRLPKAVAHRFWHLRRSRLQETPAVPSPAPQAPARS